MSLVLDDLPRLPPGYVRRERLTNLLSSVQDIPLVVVEGPPGIGKTSLVADWVSNSEAVVDCAWITLDSSIKSPENLWRILDEVLDSGLSDNSFAYASLAAALGKRDRPVRVVIDDFHWASTSVALDVLKFAELLRNGQLILITRKDAGGTLWTQAERLVSAWISAEDLYLNFAEVQQLKKALHPHGSEFTKEEFVTLQDLSEGHVLLTRLALKPHGLATAEEIAQKSAGWIVGQVEERNLRNTLRVSLLPQFNDELLQRIFGKEAARSLFVDLERSGIGHQAPQGFMTLCGPAGAAVKHLALSTLTEEEQHDTYAIAAAYFKGLKGYAVQSFELLCAAGEYEELWPYFASNFEDALDPKIIKAIEVLPHRVLTQYPMVATLKTIIQAARERTPSIGIINDVNHALALLRSGAEPNSVEEQLYEQIAGLALLWAARRFDEAEDSAEVIVELLCQLPNSNENTVHDAAYWGLLYATTMMTLCGQFDTAVKYLHAVASDRDPLRIERRTLQQAYVFAMRGDISASRQILEENTFDVEQSVHWKVVYAITSAAIQLESGFAQEAKDTLKSVESLLPHSVDWPYALTVLARAHLFISPEAGAEDLNRLLREHGDRALSLQLRDILRSAVADLSMAAGDLNHAKDLSSYRTEDDLSMSLSAARIGLINGDKKALHHLESLAEKNALGARLRAQVLNLLAVYRHRGGNKLGAQDALKRSLALAESCGIRVVQALVPRTDIEEIAKGAGIVLPLSTYQIPRLDSTLKPISFPKREYLLLHYLATSAKFKTIAAREFVSLNTIKSQAVSVYQKLGVNSRNDAVDSAKQRGLLDMELVEQLELGCLKDAET